MSSGRRAADILRQFRAADEPDTRTQVLFNHLDYVDKRNSDCDEKYAIAVWQDFKETGLFEELLDTISLPVDYQKGPEIQQQGMCLFYLNCLVTSPHFQDYFEADEEAWALLKRKGGGMYASFFDLHEPHHDDAFERNFYRMQALLTFVVIFNVAFSRRDDKYLNSIDSTRFMTFIFSLFFDAEHRFPPHRSNVNRATIHPTIDWPDHEFQSLKLCAALINPLEWSGAGYPFTGAASRAISKYGVQAIANKCRILFKEDKYGKVNIVRSSVYMIGSLQSVKDMPNALSKHGVYVAMINRAWQCLRQSTQPVSDVERVTYNLMEAWSEGQSSVSRHSLDSRIFTMVSVTKERHITDLILLTAKSITFSSSAQKSAEASTDLLLRSTARYLADIYSQNIMHDEIFRTMEHVLFAMCRMTKSGLLEPGGESSEHAFKSSAITRWIKFMTDVTGLSEASFYHVEPDSESAGGSPIFIGCSWHKCSLHGQNSFTTNRPLLQCIGCKQYCSITCRRQHWKEGGHKQRCNARSS